jgi:cytoskeletal protein RodZ
MNQKADNEQLLADVLSENTPADFREAMLGETLRLVRRRRRWQRTRRAAAMFIVLGLFAIFVRQTFLPRQTVSAPPVAKANPKSYELVRTQPLSANAIVSTRPLATEQFIASAATVETVQTRAGNFRAINDDELLALVASRPAILIRRGPNSEQLVFVNPADEKGFPVN